MRKGGKERTRSRGWATAIYRDARNFLVNAHVNRHVAYALCRVYSAGCTAVRGAGERETMKNARATIYYLRVQVTTAEQAQSLSLLLSLSLLVSHLCVLLQLERRSSETASGLLNNSLCGLVERCVCTCIDAGLFREIASARCHPPRVTVVETLFRCTVAVFRFLLAESPPSIHSDDREKPRKAIYGNCNAIVAAKGRRCI